MDNERDRRSWPDEDLHGADRADDRPSDDRPADPAATEPDWTASGDEPTAPDQPADEATGWSAQTDAGIPAQPSPGAEPGAGGGPSAAEIESWPSQEPAATEPVEPSEPAPGAEETRPWPTEPPVAGSTDPGAWPTAAPERFDAAPDASEVAAAAAAAGTMSGAPGSGGQDEDPTDVARRQTADRPPQEVEAYPAAAAGAVPPAAASAAAAAPAHSVPDGEGATGESTQCPRCGTENRPGLSFCRNCGQRLVAAGVASTVERPGAPEGTMACPRCGTHNRAGVAFCQNCGANLRGTAEGYVPPAAASQEEAAPSAQPAARGAVLGPVVLLIGLAGMITAYLLPFLYGANSLFDRAWGADGYGVAFWNGYPEVSASLADQAYFGLTAPVPILGLILLALAVAGFMRATPGAVQSVGLGIALLWSVGLIVLFVVVEVLGSWDGDIVGLLRVLTPAGIIFFLSSLIVLIGTLTRFSRG